MPHTKRKLAPACTASPDVDSLLAEIDGLREALARSHRLALMGTLAGSIAHEFNNLLTPVMSYAEMALESPTDRKLTAKALERAYRGCDRASRIASAILAFSADRGGDSSGSADVSEAVRDAMLCLAQDPTRIGVEVRTELEPELRAGIGQVSLQQIVMNLVLNAIKAMRPGGGTLSIRSRSSGAADAKCSTWNTCGSVIIEVEDTGCGIEPERIGRIFDPFVTKSAAGDPSGTGLGLTICKQLVETSGGRIEVSSQVSVGTRFTITLPLVTHAQMPLRASA
jgi:signal transduction histidine kinase